MSLKSSRPYWLAATLVLLASGCVGQVLSGAGGGDGTGDPADDPGDDPSDGLDDGGGDGVGPPPDVTPGEECKDERPGPQQIRLLTRIEYQKTMRRLLNIEVSTERLPGETRVNGFDNN